MEINKENSRFRGGGRPSNDGRSSSSCNKQSSNASEFQNGRRAISTNREPGNSRGRGNISNRSRGRGAFSSRSRKIPLTEVLKKLCDEDDGEILVELMDSTTGFLEMLNKPDSVKLDDLPDILRVLVKLSDSRTSPQLTIRLFQTFLHSRFLIERIQKFCTDEISELHRRMLPAKAQQFLVDLFRVFLELYLRLESLSHEKLYIIICGLQNTLLHLELRKASCVSALVRETFDELNNHMIAVRDRQITNCQIVTPLRSHNDQKPPDDFRNIQVQPTLEELRSSEPVKVFLRENIKVGRYESVDHYLDVQFRLLREDFVAPLRDGINQCIREQFSESGRRKKNFDVRVYTDVQVVESLTSFSGILHMVQFKTAHFERIEWENSKHFMFGSLVVLTSDNFNTVFFAVVANRDPKLLKRGLIALRFLGEVLPMRISHVMVESVVFYEAYYHVLIQLQMFSERPKSFPMADYIVFCKKSVKLPRYLLENRFLDYDLSCISYPDNVAKNALMVSPSNLDGVWPDKTKFGFDDNQMAALKTSLTKEIVIVQGPPGTGKTFIGLKIVKVLVQCVQSKVEDFGPILVVCFTNHALDQFLESIHVSMPDEELLRVGGRSKSEIMKNYALTTVRQEMSANREIPKKLYLLKRDKNDEICHVENFFNNIIDTMKASFTNLVELSDPLFVMSAIHKKNLLAKVNHRSRHYIRSWLHNNVEIEIVEDIEENGIDDIIDLITNEEIYDEILDLINSSPRNVAADETIQVEDEFTWENQRRVLDDDESLDLRRLGDTIHRNISDNSHQTMSNDSWQTRMNKKKWKNYVTRKLTNTETMTEAMALVVTDPWKLCMEDRWKLYQYWLVCYRQRLSEQLSKIEKEYNTLAEERAEIQKEIDLFIMRKSKIIGMTTTGAARNRDVLLRLGCKIVIIEEAAEVLESHIVASLSRRLQHLILIGDHKQLKPSSAVYRLAKDYGLDLSLFERLINNQLHCDTLALQHRMRPQISRIMRFIYENLKDHSSVEKYENIQGISNNVFFFDHTELESRPNESVSYSNSFEADFVVGLCYHFLKNGYAPEKITILTLYSGQLFLLKRRMPHSIFNGVIVRVVDNYQGEENDIIILSLVRSNDQEKIGFLNVENRVCVALSRAKKGFFVFGNFSLLASKNKLWHKIVCYLVHNNQLGKSLYLQCQNHPDVPPIEITRPGDFKFAPEGGCQRFCDKKLSKCDHMCPMQCHPVDTEHELFECKERCSRICINGHACRKLCFEDCECMEKVYKTMPNCGHQQKLPCCKPAENFLCHEKCKKTLECGHNCQKQCWESCDNFKCIKPCLKKCADGHLCVKKCYEDCGPCITMVQKTISSCQHIQTVPCSVPEEYFQCREKCSKFLPCGHPCQATCGKKCSEKFCKRPCTKKCECGHLCKKCCSEKCACLVMTEYVIPSCKHIQQVPCSIPPSKFVCQEKCSTILTCGHSCSKKCSEICTPESCIFKVNVTNWFCGHQHTVLCKDRMQEDLICTKPCKDVLPCGHTCKGTCGQCSIKRLHISCSAKCNRKLVCGHQCRQKCSDPCPPCQQICEDSCGHKVCRFGCSNFCEPCTKDCPLKCSHKECRKQCNEVCTIECNKSCNKIIQCNRCLKQNACLGLCREICPKFCPNCDKEKIEKLSVTTANGQYMRFITLQTCNHTFNVEVLDQHMRQEVGRQVIRRKTCPICKTTINFRSCRRYWNILKQIKINIDLIQKPFSESFGEFPKTLCDLLIKNEVFDILGKSFKLQYIIDLSQKNRQFLKRLCRPELVVSCSNSLNLLKEVCGLYQSITLICEQESQLLKKNTLRSMHDLIQWLNPESRSFSDNEITQVDNEMCRIRHLCMTIQAMQATSQLLGKSPHLKREGEKLVGCSVYTKSMCEENEIALTKYNAVKLPLFSGLTIPDRTKLQRPYDVQEGHWFIGTAGRPYFYTEDKASDLPDVFADLLTL